jgi:WD repeat-containing protein 60
LAAEVHVGPVATVLKFFPHDPNECLVGTTTGLVLRINRFQQNGTATRAASPSYDHGGSAQVECYRRERANTVAAPVPVGIAATSIAFHPFESDYFLVGYEDGRICFFSVRLATALATWEDVQYDKSVVTLQWSPSRPAVFFASYSHGLVQAWDLTAQCHAPAFEHQLAARKGMRAADTYPISLSWVFVE